MNKIFLLTTLLGLATQISWARDFIGSASPNPPSSISSFRSDCTASRSETELNINNVRARLRGGGDMWWDGTGQAQYIVPNVDPASGEPEISSLFAGAIWLGAYDQGGNLIVAAQTYRNSGNDYWSGPLNPSSGITNKKHCERWDKHFTVYGKDIDALRADFLDPINPGVQNTPSNGLLGWPGRGNPHFASINGFPIEQYDQDLAPFIDVNADGIYDPYDGDHPIIEVEGCAKNNYNNPVYADQMTWWVYNDNGNLHTQSDGLPMKMEIQALAFAYGTTDAINNMTFYRYKLLNRNSLALNDTYFSLWSDPDLGCSEDDYIGCDTATGLGYVYNSDAYDDNPCGTSAGYGDNIPLLGVDYFRGPLDSAGEEIGLSSFQYYNRQGPDGTMGPTNAQGYYRLMSGFWTNGTPITAGDDGYNPNNANANPTNYVFPSAPEETNGWSMCREQLPGLDRRFLHTSGPFVLLPGRTNEMISGVVWVPDVPHPGGCPSIRPLIDADKFAQELFDGCFKITDGPEAPYVDIVEMNQELLLNLNYVAGQRNYRFMYEETPSSLRSVAPLDSTYNFQGYMVYQVNDPNLSVTELNDESKARLIFQCDVEDNVSQIVNWEKVDPTQVGLSQGTNVHVPTIMVEGENKGIKQTFKVTADQFAPGEKELINHKPYYFCVVAYAHNEYQQFDPTTGTGQAKPYLQGRKNYQIYTGIPRINNPEYSGVTLKADYGDQPVITRIDGQGLGSQEFLEVANLEEIKERIVANQNVGRISYKEGQAPIAIKVTDPLRVGAGNFKLHVYDQAYQWIKDTIGDKVTYTAAPTLQTKMLDTVYWRLIDIDDPSQVWTAYQPIDFAYEHHIPDLGISITINQAKKPGTNGVSGALGSRIDYQTNSGEDTIKWYRGIKDGEGLFNMLKTSPGEADYAFDPNSDYAEYEGGWYPFMLADAERDHGAYYFSLGNINSAVGSGANLRNANSNLVGKVRDTMLVALNNVNIVFTPNQEEWSRCMVVETANIYHGTAGLGLQIPSTRQQGEWKGRDLSGNKPIYYSRNKDMSIDTSSVGMSWFPGYAYDVETGERLNIFFGENSCYNGSLLLSEAISAGVSTGDDMIFNPTSTISAGGFSTDEKVQFVQSVMGGQHMVFVTRQKYDSCKTLIDQQLTGGGFFSPSHDVKIYKSMDITWASIATLANGMSMKGAYQQIPLSEATIKLRVNKPFDVEVGTNDNLGYPLYEFSLDGFAPQKEEQQVATAALDILGVVPNPYYTYSDYEVTEADNVIKITNIPSKCQVRIYSMDGRFVREYKVDQVYDDIVRSGIARIGEGSNPFAENQITTSVNWDVKNNAGVPVGSGVYLIHVMVPGVGEKVLKSFVINRALDAQRL